MKTYQDLMKCRTEQERQDFVFNAINAHKASAMYKIAVDADNYERQQNTTINRYQKYLYTISGAAKVDTYSANHKCASNFFNRFVTQETQYLLGNGVTFEDEKTKDVFGGGAFDYQLMKAGKIALVEGVSFGFFNFDHVEIFRLTEFVPLWDEETGALKAGVRFWQIDDNKPLRATLYEIDGVTEYIRRNGKETAVIAEKTAYIRNERTSDVYGTEIVDFRNYGGFPIVPMWGNHMHQSEIIGIKGQIDAYDLIKSGFANDLDDASLIYWTLENAGGMDDIDLAKFIQHMKTVRAAVVDGGDGARAEAHTMDVPYQSRETYLTRLENDMYNDFMALNVNQIAAGNVTATAINAAYEPLNNKCDMFEACVGEFIYGLMALAGVDDTFTFKRSKISNMAEETAMVLSAAGYLDDLTILNHLPFLSPDEISGIIDRKAVEELDRYDDTDDTDNDTDTAAEDVDD